MLQAVHVALSPTLRCLVNLFSEGAYSDRDLDASRVEEASCQIVAGVFHGNWCPRSSGLCDYAQAAVAARYTARRVKRRCQKLIAWRMMMTVEESRSVVGAAPDSPRHICGHPSRRYSQRSRVDWHLAQALARGSVDSVGDCGDDGRSSSLAHAAGWLCAFDDVHFDRRRVMDPQHLV